eukprot:5466250-Amphidinium_carterae.1
MQLHMPVEDHIFIYYSWDFSEQHGIVCQPLAASCALSSVVWSVVLVRRAAMEHSTMCVCARALDILPTSEARASWFALDVLPCQG